MNTKLRLKMVKTFSKDPKRQKEEIEEVNEDIHDDEHAISDFQKKRTPFLNFFLLKRKVYLKD